MKVIVLGAGPAGLAAALDLCKRGAEVIVLERAEGVGGISRTVNYKGYYFDLGGHRFFTKFDEVQRLWEEVLGEDFLLRPRLSRIFYGGRFFDYPLRATNALRNLGPVESARCAASYARARLRPRGGEDSFEEWVSNRFGDRLFDIFFKSYTEKVWGLPTNQIGAEWASQRIKNLELSTAVKDALLRPLRRLRPGAKKEEVTSLIERFFYPRTGPGLMYDRMKLLVEAKGGKVLLRHTALGVEHEGGVVRRVRVQDPHGVETTMEADAVISSMPLTLLVQGLRPLPAPDVLEASRQLRFRHLLTIDLIIDKPDLFPDNWIYVHDKRLLLGRIQNFGNWSPEMVPDPNTTALGLEYFCSDEDALWKMSNEELIALGTKEIQATGLLRGGKVIDGTVVRVPRAYPVYNRGYEQHLDKVVNELKGLKNLYAVGRYGMFKYNNADHSILTALLAVENLYGANHDLWSVNTDSDYHEIRKDPPPAR
jgi:protoporphyrinogen oxidase